MIFDVKIENCSYDMKVLYMMQKVSDEIQGISHRFARTRSWNVGIISEPILAFRYRHLTFVSPGPARRKYFSRRLNYRILRLIDYYKITHLTRNWLKTARSVICSMRLSPKFYRSVMRIPVCSVARLCSFR